MHAPTLESYITLRKKHKRKAGTSLPFLELLCNLFIPPSQITPLNRHHLYLSSLNSSRCLSHKFAFYQLQTCGSGGCGCCCRGGCCCCAVLSSPSCQCLCAAAFCQGLPAGRSQHPRAVYCLHTGKCHARQETKL